MVLGIEALHLLQVERHRIAHELIVSRVKVEDYCRLMHQLKKLHIQAQLEANTALAQHKTRLTSSAHKPLGGIAHKLLSCLSIDSITILFHKDICSSRLSRRQDLTPNLSTNMILRPLDDVSRQR